MSISTVRRTVVLHPSVDACVMEAWKVLIDAGFEATYSMAVNFMLVGHAVQVGQPQGLTEEARASMWDFAADTETVRHVNIQDHLATLGQLLRDAEPSPPAVSGPHPDGDGIPPGADGSAGLEGR